MLFFLVYLRFLKELTFLGIMHCCLAEGFGCNNNGNGNGNNMRDLDMNQPASGGEEEEFPMGSVEEEEDERGGAGGRGPHRSKKLRLSKEQSRLLEESFRFNHTPTPVSQHPITTTTSLLLLVLLASCHGILPCPAP